MAARKKKAKKRGTLQAAARKRRSKSPRGKTKTAVQLIRNQQQDLRGNPQTDLRTSDIIANSAANMLGVRKEMSRENRARARKALAAFRKKAKKTQGRKR